MVTSVAPPGFVAPDLSSPIDVRAVLSIVPTTATCKGMFFKNLIARFRGRTAPTTKNYATFKDYPLTEWCELAVESARLLYTNAPLRRALYEFGKLAYPTFAETLPGKVMFGVLGSHLPAIFRVVPKGYQASLTPVTIELVEVDASSAILSFEQVYSFFDSYHVGVCEGIPMACGKQAEVKIRARSASGGDLWVRWWG